MQNQLELMDKSLRWILFPGEPPEFIKNYKFSTMCPHEELFHCYSHPPPCHSDCSGRFYMMVEASQPQEAQSYMTEVHGELWLASGPAL